MGSYLWNAVKDRSQEECFSPPSKSFLCYGKSLKLVDENLILARSAGKKKLIGLHFVGFAARVAGVRCVDVVVLMWRVVTGFHCKMIGCWAEA